MEDRHPGLEEIVCLYKETRKGMKEKTGYFFRKDISDAHHFVVAADKRLGSTRRFSGLKS